MDRRFTREVHNTAMRKMRDGDHDEGAWDHTNPHHPSNTIQYMQIGCIKRTHLLNTHNTELIHCKLKPLINFVTFAFWGVQSLCVAPRNPAVAGQPGGPQDLPRANCVLFAHQLGYGCRQCW